MRVPILAAVALALGLSAPAWAGPLKVMSVDRQGMVVLDRPTVRRTGDTVTARVLSVSNRGFLPLEFYEQPLRSSISVDCGAGTFTYDGGAARPVSAVAAAARTADWLCRGVAPRYAIEANEFSALARGYQGYVAYTPGIFFTYEP